MRRRTRTSVATVPGRRTTTRRGRTTRQPPRSAAGPRRPNRNRRLRAANNRVSSRVTFKLCYIVNLTNFRLILFEIHLARF